MYDSKHRTTDTQIYDSRKDASGSSSNKRDWNSQTHGSTEEMSNHRKYMRTQSSSNNNRVVSNSSSSQQQRENGEKKALKDTKKPLRSFGDWSEFKSSTGKTYFYNSKTEVSQWEKPKGWLPDDSSNRTSCSSTPSNNRIKKESTTNVSSTVCTRYKMEESSTDRRLSQTSNLKITSENSNHHLNGNRLYQQSHEQIPIVANNRLPTSDDDSSRMSFSSTSSKESASTTNQSNGTTLNSSLSQPAISVSTPVREIQAKSFENNTKLINGNDNKNSISQSTAPTPAKIEPTTVTETESTTPIFSKAERDQDLQKYYRAELIEHLTGWQSGLLEKQCLKIFDDYYGYSARTSTAFTELKALKSNFRILEIKRNILTQRHLRCQQHVKQSEENRNF
ncbi:unnamed protein product [Rotaria magnacalcarata]|uniref:WW domain-containing protein n=6 Tax=Rotaria magnacalcarata TaxID=392030 RepID=A0A814H6L3_9BILA|nr:unnamed protein product [Rotaria magnacalcarata]CAF1664796.1 unnamed protein product [Rotaria magnacalcarata]CAF2095563.1 unnamed protein product [Rotaria magnacalcarata]